MAVANTYLLTQKQVDKIDEQFTTAFNSIGKLDLIETILIIFLAAVAIVVSVLYAKKDILQAPFLGTVCSSIGLILISHYYFRIQRTEQILNLDLDFKEFGKKP